MLVSPLYDKRCVKLKSDRERYGARAPAGAPVGRSVAARGEASLTREKEMGSVVNNSVCDSLAGSPMG